MNRIFKFILTCLICVAMLIFCIACETSSSGEKDSYSRKNNGDSLAGESMDLWGKKLNIDEGISYGSPFSEGCAFVQIGGDKSVTYCINKTGEIVFELVGDYSVERDYNAGLAILNSDDGICICNMEGKLTTAEDLGASEIYLLDNSYINSRYKYAKDQDVYIALKRTTTDYRGSVDEAAIINSKFEVVVDYSQELFQEIKKFKNSYYYDGFLFHTTNFEKEIKTYLDLRTGVVYEDGTEFFSKINLKHKSDFWLPEDSQAYYDIRTKNGTVLDLSEYDDTISLGYFEDGYATVIFNIQESNGKIRSFFTLLTENGSFSFEPIEIKNDDNVARNYSSEVVQEGSSVVIIKVEEKLNQAKLQTRLFSINKDGIIAELVIDGGSYTDYTLSDGVLMRAAWDKDLHRTYTYYNLNLSPLF